MPPHPAPQLISLTATATKLGVGKSTLRRMIARGEFVSAVQVAPRRIAFVEAEVEEWITRRPRGPLPPPAMRWPSASRAGALIDSTTGGA
ncbi:helix-turn-helix transcriptional regulator [Massilia sp. PWRC2]|uniref:helix-turn-helix transcriptional regulator n=1 Tax=Massilia sp. PWRC2 TaxID=2804626 RepID=UPI003CFA1E72